VATSNETLKERLARYREIKITVIGRKSGKKISVPVWFVFEEDKSKKGTLYLLPVQGSDTQWLQERAASPVALDRCARRRSGIPSYSRDQSNRSKVRGREIPGEVWGEGREEVLFQVRRCGHGAGRLIGPGGNPGETHAKRKFIGTSREWHSSKSSDRRCFVSASRSLLCTGMLRSR
jgi:hypothetical protein